MIGTTVTCMAFTETGVRGNVVWFVDAPLPKDTFREPGWMQC